MFNTIQQFLMLSMFQDSDSGKKENVHVESDFESETSDIEVNIHFFINLSCSTARQS